MKLSYWYSDPPLAPYSGTLQRHAIELPFVGRQDDHAAVDAEGAAERRCGCTARYIVVKSKGTSSKFWFWF